jgi:hypothetical protein
MLPECVVFVGSEKFADRDNSYCNFVEIAFINTEPGSSVSIVSDYGLDDRAIEVRSSAEVRECFL